MNLAESPTSTRSRRVIVAVAAAWMLGLLLVGGAQAQGEREPTPDGEVLRVPANVVVIDIEGPLNAGHMALLQRGIGVARGDDATLLVRVNTPGGEVTRMRQIAAAIDLAIKEGVPVATWVTDEALSAGVWITITGQPVIMAPLATIGAAEVVTLGPEGMQPAPEKIKSAYRAWVRSWAEEHGRSPEIAEAMIDSDAVVREVRDADGLVRFMGSVEWDDAVRGGREPELLRTISPGGKMLTLTARQAVELGFADSVADDLDEVLGKLGLPNGRVEVLEATRSEELLGQLHSLRFLLLFIGLLLGYIELKAPGFGLPGLLSIGCFVVLFTGQYLVGLADVPHLTFAALGIVLIAVELFIVPGFIWFGLTGVLCLIGALVTSQLGPGLSIQDAWDRELLVDASFDLALTAVLAMLGIWALSRFLPQTPLLGRLVLAGDAGAADAGMTAQEDRADALPESRDADLAVRVGALGRTVTALRPVGKVRLDQDPPGVEHEARCPGDLLEPDVRVRVVRVRSGRLEVEPADSEPATSTGSPA